MANTNIEWTNGGKVWNPVVGCNKVSPGCKNCYAEKMHKRLRGMGQAKYQSEFLAGAKPWEADLLYPLTIKKPTTFFVNSMSDLFHHDVPVEYIAQVFAVMRMAGQHTFQVLTKRPEKMQSFLWLLPAPALIDAAILNIIHETKKIHLYKFIQQKDGLHEWPLPNVWLGTSVENMATAEERIPYLQNTPAHIRFLSMEPLLEAIDLEKVYARSGIEPNMHWIIVGGESGPKRRPFDPNWAREIRDWCKQYNIAFFMKQWDKVKPVPEDLQIRYYPNGYRP